MEDELRQSGIDVIGEVPWGTHFCQFYQTKQDLIDILVPYFQAGLENNEFCMWITSEPLIVAEVQKEMRRVVSSFDEYLGKGQIEIIPYDEWYLKKGTLDLDNVLAEWVVRLKDALSRNFSGLRVTGNTLWLERSHWKAFTEYEARVNEVIGNHKMLAICTYCMDRCTGADVIDVVKNHEFALINKDGTWDIIESDFYKKTKQSLIQSEKELNRAQAVAHIGSWRMDVRRNRLLWSDETYRIFNIDVGTPMTYEAFLSGVHPDDREYVNVKWTAALCGEPYDIEHRIIAGSEVKWVHERAELEFDAEGILVGGFGTVQDITESRRIEEALKHEEFIRRTIMENTGAHLAYLDRDFNYVMVNSTYAESTGHTEEYLLYRNYFTLFPDEENRAIFERVRDTGKVAVYYDKPLEFKNQPEKGVTYWDWTLTPVKDSTDRVQGLVLSLIDTTARKKVEDLKDSFIGMISHELRTPLTVINGCISTILSEWDRLSIDEIQQLLMDAVLETDSLSHLVENLLELSRFQAQQLALYSETTDIKNLVVDTINKIQRQVSSHSIVAALPDSPVSVRSDPLRVQRILYNLLENAVKYSPQESQITITTITEPERLVISVHNEGDGLSKSEQGRIFAPFSRLEEARPDSMRGAGLGLMVCRVLVEAHGGEIWVESKKGKGATFFFSLPIKRDAGRG